MKAKKLASQTGGPFMFRANTRLFVFLFISAAIHIHAQQPVQMASLRPGRELVWQRTSPSAEKPDGPVLYQILFRSSAHIGSIPKIGPTYTLVDSGLMFDNGGNPVIGGPGPQGTPGGGPAPPPPTPPHTTPNLRAPA